VREAACNSSTLRFTALLHHIDERLLFESFDNLKKSAAPGVDGVTWSDYEVNVEANIKDLHDRIHRGAYRAEPSRRVWIPKPDGRQRPLGVVTDASGTHTDACFGLRVPELPFGRRHCFREIRDSRFNSDGPRDMVRGTHQLHFPWKSPGWVALQSTASTIQLPNPWRFWRIGVSLRDVFGGLVCPYAMCLRFSKNRELGLGG
jgi:hypothetical protein